MQIIIPKLSRSPYAIIVINAVIIGFTATILRIRKSGVSRQSIIYTGLLTFVCTIITSLIFGFKITSEGIGAGFSGLGAAVGMIGGVFVSGLIIRDKPDLSSHLLP